MEAELARLAASVATTAAGTVGTDVYTAFKARVGAFFRRGGQEREDSFLSGLEELRSDLTLARDRGDEDGVADSVAAIERLPRSELRRLLREQPLLVGELRDLHTEAGNVVTNGTLVGGHTHVSNPICYCGWTPYARSDWPPGFPPRCICMVCRALGRPPLCASGCSDTRTS